MQVKRPRYRKRWVDITPELKNEIYYKWYTSGKDGKILAEENNISEENISKIITDKLNDGFKR
jgi:hypothetical protein